MSVKLKNVKAEVSASTAELSSECDIKIEEVRIRNFRSLKNVNVKLDNLTILIGENNSGKTSFLEALTIAIGATRRNFVIEDVYLDNGEKEFSKSKKIIIDILIRPIDKKGKRIDRFPQACFWIGHWGNGISQDKELNDFVGIRTEGRWDENKNEFITERKFLSEWSEDITNIEDTKTSDVRFFYGYIEPFALYYMDAKRDLQDELRMKGSFLNRLISDLDLDEEKKSKIEQDIANLNDKITTSSEVLSHLSEHLNDIGKMIACDRESVEITPLPIRLRDLRNSMDVNIATNGAPSFSLSKHGMGTRCLAALLVFRAYTTWRQKKFKDYQFHSMLALEEPEAHLHPQAQRALFKQIDDIPGQRIVSTHSPYIVSQASISDLRHFQRKHGETEVTNFDVTNIEDKDLIDIQRFVMNTRGDLLFARAIILFEGDTEEIALPIYANSYWGKSPSSLGLSLIGVGGYGKYAPFIKLAQSFGIPWYIFSDGEERVLKHLKENLSSIGIDIDSPNIFIIPDGKNYEGHITREEYKDILVKIIIDDSSMNDTHRKALEKEWASKQNVLDEIYKILSNNKNKVRLAKPIAMAITELKEERYRFPPTIRAIFDKVSIGLGYSIRRE